MKLLFSIACCFFASLLTDGHCHVSCDDPNAVVSKCYHTYCSTASCQKIGLIGMCMPDCSRTGCECKSGYILNEYSGLCVDISLCPRKDIDCSIRNEHIVHKKCRPTCHVTCLKKDSKKEDFHVCPPDCSKPGCRCEYGYYLNEFSGQCFSNSSCNIANEIVHAISESKIKN